MNSLALLMAVAVFARVTVAIPVEDRVEGCKPTCQPRFVCRAGTCEPRCPSTTITGLINKNGRTYFKVDTDEVKNMYHDFTTDASSILAVVKHSPNDVTKPSDVTWEIAIWGDGHGRRNPYSSAATGDWAVGDTIELESCVHATECDELKQGIGCSGSEIHIASGTNPLTCQAACVAVSTDGCCEFQPDRKKCMFTEVFVIHADSGRHAAVCRKTG